MIKIVVKILAGVAVISLAFVSYVIWDNNRITTAEQDIVIDNLPEQFEDFRILQVSDLHEKEFGHNQGRLIDAINALDYDAIVFTGDMLDSTESSNSQSFYSLLEGIDNKKNAWFVPGNTDPHSYQLTPDIGKSEFIKGMEDRGVDLLESSAAVEQQRAAVHFVNFELAIVDNPEHIGRTNGTVRPPYVSEPSYQTYQKQKWEDFQKLRVFEESDVLIALNHYPVVDARVDYIRNSSNTVWQDFDLIMAGHYHGGQIRLPFVGALFVPEPWYDNNFLPPDDRVKGLWEYEGTQQYVSAGLGSSDYISFLKFRLFTPPEINLLTLVGEETQ